MATMCVEEVLQQLSDIDTDISSDEPDGSSSSIEESDMLEYSSEECDESSTDESDDQDAACAGAGISGRGVVRGRGRGGQERGRGGQERGRGRQVRGRGGRGGRGRGRRARTPRADDLLQWQDVSGKSNACTQL